MFNFKDKLNQFLDDLEEEEVERSENNGNQKSEQQKLADYLSTLEKEKPQDPTNENIQFDTNQLSFTQVDIPTTSVNLSDDKPSPHNTSHITSYFSDDVVITGSIESNNSIQLDGCVKGNVTCSEKVILNGTIDGDLKANSASLTHANVTGNITVEENMVIDSTSNIKGDIFAHSLAIDGYIKGSIRAKGKVIVKENATIQGNLSAAVISVAEGAIIEGNIKINAKRK